jgi:hypothetical protein
MRKRKKEENKLKNYLKYSRIGIVEKMLENIKKSI